MKRTVPVIRTLREVLCNIPTSIDTRHSQVARAAIEAGADIVNDVSVVTFDPVMFASVDSRMVKEMRKGIQAMQSGDVHQVIKANAGGPYGSEVLKSILQRESDAVWDAILLSDKEAGEGETSSGSKGASVGRDWFKASIQIHARNDGDWTANAILPDGTKGTVFQFHPPRKV